MTLLSEVKALTKNGQARKDQEAQQKKDQLHQQRVATAQRVYDYGIEHMEVWIKDRAKEGGRDFVYNFAHNPNPEDWPFAQQLAKLYRDQGFEVSVVESTEPQSEISSPSLRVIISW